MSDELLVLDDQEIAKRRPESLREWAIRVRDVLPKVNIREKLEELESSLVAVSRHLRKLGEDASEVEKSRVLTMQRVGELLGPAERGRDDMPAGPGRGHKTVSVIDDTVLPQSHPKPRAQRDLDYQCRLLAQEKDAVKRALEPAKPGQKLRVAVSRVVKQAREAKREKEQAAVAPGQAVVTRASYAEWLATQPDCDLLITDPPYMTDVPDVRGFAKEWVPLALSKVKRTGQAFICTGAYPVELNAYLDVLLNQDAMTMQTVLVWTYRNTLGADPARFGLNWQAIHYLTGPDAPVLNSDKSNEKRAVIDISAPDGRQGNRYHTWQKPDELAKQLVSLGSREGDLVLDPFAGTGTFLLAASRLGRCAHGCDADPAMVEIARKRGCAVSA